MFRHALLTFCLRGRAGQKDLKIASFRFSVSSNSDRMMQLRLKQYAAMRLPVRS